MNIYELDYSYPHIYLFNKLLNRLSCFNEMNLYTFALTQARYYKNAFQACISLLNVSGSSG